MNSASEQVAKNAQAAEDKAVEGIKAALSRVKKARSEELAAIRQNNTTA